MLTNDMLRPLYALPIFVLAITVLIITIMLLFRKSQFANSCYGEISGNGFFKTFFDTGLLGEFYTVRELEKIKGNSKIIVNAYIPKSDGTTTEIDVICINQNGIFVIESKNYSGWIFGDENGKNWTQTLKGEKNKFYNPIMQNKGHITELAKYIKFSEQKFKSIIVFSERCELKKIDVKEETARVIKRNKLSKTIREYQVPILSDKDIMYAFAVIKGTSMASEETKAKHIENIKARK